MAHIIQKASSSSRKSRRQAATWQGRGTRSIYPGLHALGARESEAATVGVTPQTTGPPPAAGGPLAPLGAPATRPDGEMGRPGLCSPCPCPGSSRSPGRARPALGAPCAGGAPRRRSRGRSRRCWAWCGAGPSRSAGSPPTTRAREAQLQRQSLHTHDTETPGEAARDPCMGQTSGWLLSRKGVPQALGQS